MEDAEDMSPINLHIVYDGPALENHRMDVKDLAPALLALGGLVDRANEVLNQDRAKVRVEVQASFREGSFGITFEVIQSLRSMFDFLSGNPITGTLNLVALLGLARGGGKGALWLLRKLKGRTIERFELLPDGKAVVYVDQEQHMIEKEVLELVRDHKIRRHFESLIAKPLDQDGIETFAVADPKTKKVEVLVDKSESSYFIAPIGEIDMEETDEYIARLQIVTISFQDGNKWRFSDGQQSFYATISDEIFNQRVTNREEQFGKGDIIRAKVRRRQYMADGDKLRADYEIIEVLQHLVATPMIQNNLPLPPPEN